MSRSTGDLINDLLVAGVDATPGYAALVVGFDNRTEFVLASDAGALDRLNRLIQLGGDPMGIMKLTMAANGTEAELAVAPLQEYMHEEWVEKYLLTLGGELRRRIEGISP